MSEQELHASLGTEDTSEEQVSEFLRELANMVCGAVVSTLDGRGHYSLGTPRMVAPQALAATGVRCDFEIDGGIL